MDARSSMATGAPNSKSTLANILSISTRVAQPCPAGKHPVHCAASLAQPVQCQDIAERHSRPWPTSKALIATTLHPAVAPNHWSQAPHSWSWRLTSQVWASSCGRGGSRTGHSAWRRRAIRPGAHFLSAGPPSLARRPGPRIPVTRRPAGDVRHPEERARRRVRPLRWAGARRVPRGAAALPCDEAGESPTALACLETGRAQPAHRWGREEPAWTAPRHARIDRVPDYVRAVAARRNGHVARPVECVATLPCGLPITAGHCLRSIQCIDADSAFDII